MRERIERIAKRLQVEPEVVEEHVDEFKYTGMVPVLNYLERRLEMLRGDESVKYELEQIRLDLAAFSMLKAIKTETPDEII